MQAPVIDPVQSHYTLVKLHLGCLWVAGTQEMDVTNWVRGAETLQLFTGFVAMQASAGAPCTADTA